MIMHVVTQCFEVAYPLRRFGLPGRCCSRRIRSIARLRAVDVIQAPGLSGIPSRGQRSNAIANASCTASSARSKSPSTRMSVATARPDSRRNRRSTTSAASLTCR